MGEIWDGLVEHLSKEELETVAVILWTTWNFRNKATLGTNRTNVQELTRQIKRHIAEQRKSRNDNQWMLTSENQENQEVWTPPPTGLLKINVDASWNDDQRRGGVGWIIRDSHGSPVGMGSAKIKQGWSIRSMEAATVKEGLEAYLVSKGGSQSRILIESDSIDVVKALNHEDEDVSETRVILDEIHQLASLVGEVSFVERFWCTKLLS